MVTTRSCTLEGIELCLDAEMASGTLSSLGEARRLPDVLVEQAIRSAGLVWESIKERLLTLEECGLDLVNDRIVGDIDNNLRTLRLGQRSLDVDGPFVAAQIRSLVRFEILTSGGKLSRR